MADPAFLQLAGLAKSFGALVVVDDLSLTVAEGEVLALLGPSGSGKTTLLRLLAGFERPDRGRIEVGGRDVTRLAAEKRGFGMVFQHYALFPHLDVAGNVAFGLRAQGVARAEAARRVGEVLELVGLAGFERRAVAELSGGQQQRVAVARALAPEPRLLLLDEPLSNLDPGLRERTRRALAELVRRLGITTVLVTHEQQEAFDLGDRVAVLSHGRLQQLGTADELYERPANRFVAGFVGRANLLPGTFRAGPPAAVALTGSGGVVWPGEPSEALVEGAPAELLLRPDALALVAAPAGVAGTVVERLYGGATSLFRVALAGIGDGAPAEVEVVAPSAAASPGEAVRVAPLAGGLPGRIWSREGGR